MSKPPPPFFSRFFPGEETNVLAGYHRCLEARLPSRGKILDLGCGDLTQLARYRTADREVWGTDWQVHPRLTDAAWFRLLQPGGGLPFAPGTFDLVACSWVLEHVADPKRFLRQTADVLRPGGWFVALTINGGHYVPWIKRLFHALPHTVTQRVVHRLYGRPDEDTFPTHYRLNTPAQMRRAAVGSNLRLTDLFRVANQGYFAFWGPLWRLAVMADWGLDRLRPGAGRIYLVAAWRKDG